MTQEWAARLLADWGVRPAIECGSQAGETHAINAIVVENKALGICGKIGLPDVPVKGARPLACL
jgi:hypothetical protein